MDSPPTREQVAEARLSAALKVVEAAERCIAAMEYPYCKDTPEGHLAAESIYAARTLAIRAVAAYRAVTRTAAEKAGDGR